MEMLEAIVRDAEGSNRLADLWLATDCLLGFSGFLHFDELINLRPCDIVVEAEMRTIKTDQLRQRDTVVVVRSGSITCPVTMLERYLARTATAADDRRFLFHPIQSTKNGESLRNLGKISYSCLAEYQELEADFELGNILCIHLRVELLRFFLKAKKNGLPGFSLGLL